MRSNLRSDVIIAFLLGIVIALGAVVLTGGGAAFDRAYAGTAAGDGGLFGVTGLATGGSKDMFWLIDAQGQRVALYDAQGDVIQLRSVRNVRYDLKLDEYPPRRQKPSVLEIFKQVEQAPADKGKRSRGG